MASLASRVNKSDKPALTESQMRIFQYICKYIEQSGYPPAIRDIGKAFDIASPNGVMCHLRALQKKGYIQRDEKNEERGGRARSITIPGVSAGGFSLPLLGVVAAGATIEAVQQDERLEMRELFGQDNLYVLKVRGSSMIDSQIADGDYVVIKKQDSADNGEKSHRDGRQGDDVEEVLQAEGAHPLGAVQQQHGTDHHRPQQGIGVGAGCLGRRDPQVLRIGRAWTIEKRHSGPLRLIC